MPYEQGALLTQIWSWLAISVAIYIGVEYFRYLIKEIRLANVDDYRRYFQQQ